MTLQETRVFKLLDDYSRNRHNCFLAEMFLNQAQTAYTLCFRPVNKNKNSPDRYACRYLHLEASELKIAAEKGSIGASTIEELDKELPLLGLTV